MRQSRIAQTPKHLPYDPRGDGDSVLCIQPNHPESLFFVEASKVTRVFDPAVAGTRVKGLTPLTGPSITAVTSVGAILARNRWRDLFSLISANGETGLYDTFGSAIDSAGDHTVYAVVSIPNGQGAATTSPLIGGGVSSLLCRIGDGSNPYHPDTVRDSSVDLGIATNPIIQTPAAFPTPTLVVWSYSASTGVTYYMNGQLNGSRAASGVMTGNFTSVFGDRPQLQGFGGDIFLFDVRNTAHSLAQVQYNSKRIREAHFIGAW